MTVLPREAARWLEALLATRAAGELQAKGPKKSKAAVELLAEGLKKP